MIQLTTCVLQTRLNVLRLKVREILKDLMRGQAARQEIQDVNHPYAQAPDTGPPATLRRVYRDAIHVPSLQYNLSTCSCEAATLACVDATGNAKRPRQGLG